MALYSNTYTVSRVALNLQNKQQHSLVYIGIKAVNKLVQLGSWATSKSHQAADASVAAFSLKTSRGCQDTRQHRVNERLKCRVNPHFNSNGRAADMVFVDV
jgi:hypothetical protein